jgi:hypothetical protein
VSDEDRYGDEASILGTLKPEDLPKPKPKPRLVVVDGERVAGEVLEFRIVEDE